MIGLFNSYVSRHGFTVLGERPMFEPYDDEALPGAIKAKIFEVFGCYPVLDISEDYTLHNDFMGDPLEDGPVQLRDYHLIIDTEKVDLVDGWSLNYVDSLFEKVIEARIKDENVREVNANASKKYCFSDTEDWWDAMKVEGDSLPSDRLVITLSVELG